VSTYIIFTIVAGFSIFSGALTILLFPYSYSMGTALIGAFAIGKGINMIVGGYVNEYTLAMEIAEGRISNVGYTTYLYLVGTVIVAIIGFVIQVSVIQISKFVKSKYKNVPE
jgi:hypothetical protein